MTGTEFKGFGKIPRYYRDITVTEKLDGSNGQVLILPVAEAGAIHPDLDYVVSTPVSEGEHVIRVGSRKRWVHPGKGSDNFGWAGWVRERAEQMVAFLGEGRHFGEFVGPGIQGNQYELSEKQWVLFITDRWEAGSLLPEGVRVVPQLYVGPRQAEVGGLKLDMVDFTLGVLRDTGSMFGKGQAEGIIVWDHAARTYHKVLMENDQIPKGLVP